jgi:hypothetical protein
MTVAPAVLSELQGALGSLLAAAPTEITKAVHVERAFAIDHQTGWQVYQVVAAENPLAAVRNVPTPTAMKRLLKSATRRRIADSVLQRVTHAYAAFEGMVQRHAQDRSEFNAMVQALLPDERRKQLLASKESVFKGSSQIRGAAVETILRVAFLFPSADGVSIDGLSLIAQHGVRRLNPGAKIGFGVMPLSADGFRSKSLTGDDGHSPESLLLPEFCSKPLPRFETVEVEGAKHHWIVVNDMGMRSAIDLTIAYRSDARWPRTSDGAGKQHVGVHEVIDVPTARLTFDVYAHQELFNGAAPELAVYQTIAHGVVRKIGDPSREDDRLHLGDSIEPLSSGIAGAGLGHAPDYLRILDRLCASSGFSHGAFRGYRMDTQYPFYGAQYSIRFKLP